ncbi:MAG TPA: sugar transferase [Verrucomicrobiae bacterium]|nr:sugar transferase [Verrucomicrobiae bacterium]
MLRRDRQLKIQVFQLVDACLFALSFWLAYKLREDPRMIYHFRLDPFGNDPKLSFEKLVWIYPVLVFISPLVLEGQGFYSRSILSSRRVKYWQLFKSCFIMVLALVLAMFFSKVLVVAIARWIPLWFGAISFVLVVLREEIVSFLASSKMAGSRDRRHFVLIGSNEETVRMRQEIKARPEENIEVVAALNLSDTTIPQLVELLHEYSVNGVILSAKHAYFEHVEQAIRACELEGVEAWLIADFFKTQISRTSFDDFYGQPVMVFRTTPDNSWQSALKRPVDIVGSIIVLVVLSPVYLIVALLIKLTSPGPILFRQQRSGLNGRPFTIYKFRTMAIDAEARKKELASLNEMRGPVFKVTNDPRITPIGRVLRRYSIDEFPQFFNVLRGEMSLVGPRPLPVDEVKRFDDFSHRRRLSVKPGLTCLWQVSGRNNVVDFKDWVRLDLEYIDNWSLWLDLKILWRTVPVVLGGVGAK